MFYLTKARGTDAAGFGYNPVNKQTAAGVGEILGEAAVGRDRTVWRNRHLGSRTSRVFFKLSRLKSGSILDFSTAASLRAELSRSAVMYSTLSLIGLMNGGEMYFT